MNVCVKFGKWIGYDTSRNGGAFGHDLRLDLHSGSGRVCVIVSINTQKLWTWNLINSTLINSNIHQRLRQSGFLIQHVFGLGKMDTYVKLLHVCISNEWFRGISVGGWSMHRFLEGIHAVFTSQVYLQDFLILIQIILNVDFMSALSTWGDLVRCAVYVCHCIFIQFAHLNQF